MAFRPHPPLAGPASPVSTAAFAASLPSRGSVTLIRAPPIGPFPASMDPPWSITIFFTIVSPSPSHPASSSRTDRTSPREARSSRGLRLSQRDKTDADLERREGSILDDLSLRTGIVGITARFARSRMDRAGTFGTPKDPPSSSRSPAEFSDSPPSSRVQPPPLSAEPPLPLRELAPPLAHAMGQEKSYEALVSGARRVGLPEDRLDRSQASRLFEDLARQDGLVGITASFAKARLFLKFGT